MQEIFSLYFNLFIVSLVTGLVIAWQLWRYINADIRTVVRVHAKGGTERRYDAVEVGSELRWYQSGEEMVARIPMHVAPGHTRHWGIPYRIFNVIDGSDEALLPPWHEEKGYGLQLPDYPRDTKDLPAWVSQSNELMEEYFALREAAEKERHRRRTRAHDTFKQIAAGLAKTPLRMLILAMLLGLFMGLYLSPIIAGALS